MLNRSPVMVFILQLSLAESTLSLWQVKQKMDGVIRCNHPYSMVTHSSICKPLLVMALLRWSRKKLPVEKLRQQLLFSYYSYSAQSEWQ